MAIQPSKTVNVGIVGCGGISGVYLSNITHMFKEINVIGVCDLIRDRAKKAVEICPDAKLYKDMDEMFKDDDVDIVLNITRPYEHFGVSMAAIRAGKHVYSEKPLGITVDEGKALLKEAQKYNVSIGGAPDTFMGAGIQTCRKLIDDGFIGTPVGASAFMAGRGPESWHHDPEFFYKWGGGPMFDMGPYYVTALINLLGGIKSVAGMAKISFPQRKITSEPKFGTVVDVETPTYINGLINFGCGAQGTIFTAFDVHKAELPIIEVYGSDGTLSVPDPNFFGGDVRLFRPEDGEFRKIPLMFDYTGNNRALGLADMAKAIQTGREMRAGIQTTFHVLEVMSGFLTAARETRYVDIESTFERPAPMVKAALPGYVE